MTTGWQKTTLKLTAAQARHLWWLLSGIIDVGDEDPKRLSSWRAIRRKLVEGR